MGALIKNINSIFVGIIRLYQIILSPVFGKSCRFEPTCSQYSIDAFRAFSTIRAVVLTFKRISKCHPFSRGGTDPIPR
ncbi:MAG: membrane protein insertion efficiency factor YidD [Candidatus Marinimicrobia bacterium]|nr:membrane protein insertion efficiency factor YidD [Candidatus Neomarinimicrobiota bacterium]